MNLLVFVIDKTNCSIHFCNN